MVDNDYHAGSAKDQTPDSTHQGSREQRACGEGTLQEIDMESEMPFFIMQDLSENGAQYRILKAVSQSPEIALGNHLGHKQDEQLMMQTEQPT